MFSFLLTSFLQLGAIVSLIAQLIFPAWITYRIFFYLAFYTKVYYAVILSYIWVFIDWQTPRRGGRRSEWIRKLSIWKYVASYFPVKLIKTVDLDPNKNYLCGYHPHGILCIGSSASFATDGLGFSQIFPDIKPYVLNHNLFYTTPIIRDIVMSFGCCSVSEESISWILSEKGKGNMAVIIVGGAAEMLDSHPRTAVLTLRNRKGFVKLAIKTGASLIPIFGFGENDLFTQLPNPRGSLVRRTQEFLRNIIVWPPVIFRGRTFPPCFWTLFPKSKPVLVVVGKPIDVVLNPNPSEEEVNRYHDLYVDGLRALFDDYKKNCRGYENVGLEIA